MPRKMCNFAHEMERKRQIASWILLAVFVPMMVLSSLHVHHVDDDSDIACAECVDHHCAGHITQQSGGIHQCVLCQFLTLPLAVATVVVMAFMSFAVKRIVICGSVSHIIYRGERVHCLRAPPFCFSL